LSGDVKAIVAAGYERVAERYAALEAASSAWPRLRRLNELLARLPEGSRVLDVGCGNGLPGLAAIAERHRATGIDVSSAQVEAAVRNVPTARVLRGDVGSYAFATGSFDAIVAFYVLEHLPREEHRALFERFARWLRPGGFLLFTTEAGEDPGTVGEWLDVPMFFSQFAPAETAALVEAAGFDLVAADDEAQLEGDQDVEYAWFLARRR
jgi:cyclopropane fatty-acyl-phospholipid synthase-like methyltransferase